MKGVVRGTAELPTPVSNYLAQAGAWTRIAGIAMKSARQRVYKQLRLVFLIAHLLPLT